jgi:hypothetical protein
MEVYFQFKKVRLESWRLKEVSRLVTSRSLLRHAHEHHQRVANAIYKATTGLSVEQSNLLCIKTLLNLIMWWWSYRVRSVTRLGGVARILIWPAY